MKPIQAVFCDNEGCILPGKGLAFPLHEIATLRSFLKDHTTVGYSICTGRSIPYVEAMVQTLDLISSSVPCVCEGGAALYWPRLDKWEIISNLSDKETLLKAISGMNYREELGKTACLSLYPNSPTTVDDLYSALVNNSTFNEYNITKSIAAIDITPFGVNKGFGVRETCKRLGISLSQVLCIGDAQNDIPMLEAAGYSACPSNAVAEVKRIVNFIAPSEATSGVLEILKHYEPLFLMN